MGFEWVAGGGLRFKVLPHRAGCPSNWMLLLAATHDICNVRRRAVRNASIRASILVTRTISLRRNAPSSVTFSRTYPKTEHS